MRIDVTAIWPDGDEAVGMLQAEMPGARRTHRHAAQHDAVAIDVVVAAHRLDGLENIRLARPAVSVLHTTKRMQLDVVHVRRVASVLIAFVEAADEL